MIHRYKIDESQTIISNEMPDIIKGSFGKEIIRHHALTIHSLMLELHRKAKRTDPSEAEKAVYYIESLELAAGQLNDIISKQTLPENVKTVIIENLKKKDQERLLKGIALTDEQVFELFCFAEENGFDFTSIKYNGHPKNIAEEDLPKLAYKDNSGKILTVGGNVSEGQARQLIDQNKVLIARIISKEDRWHCLLQTFRGLKGQESGAQGSRAHLHYLSDKTTGITFDELVAQIKNGDYPKAPVHIPLLHSTLTTDNTSSTI